MAESSSRLRQIAAEIWGCIPQPELRKSSAPGVFWAYVGKLVDEAISTCGAFPQYSSLRALIGKTKLERPNDWQAIAFVEAVFGKASLVHGCWDAFDRLADAIESEQPPSPQLKVDLPSKTLTFDGVEYDVSSERALRWVKILADRAPDWISGTDLEKLDADLNTKRPDQLKKYLPLEIRNLIESRTGAGSTSI